MDELLDEETPAFTAAQDAYTAWWGERGTMACPACHTATGGHHRVPCPLDRGVMPCRSWRRQPSIVQGALVLCECGASWDRHHQWGLKLGVEIEGL